MTSQVSADASCVLLDCVDIANDNMRIGPPGHRLNLVVAAVGDSSIHQR